MSRWPISAHIVTVLTGSWSALNGDPLFVGRAPPPAAAPPAEAALAAVAARFMEAVCGPTLPGMVYPHIMGLVTVGSQTVVSEIGTSFTFSTAGVGK